MAVAVELDRLGTIDEGDARDAFGVDLAGDELVDQQRVFRERLGGRLQVRGHEVGVLVAEAEDGGGFDADERRLWIMCVAAIGLGAG